MKRRDVLGLLSRAAAAWPVVARAQQGERMRHIGVLMSFAANDPEAQARLLTFREALEKSGWVDGRNVQIDARWAAGRPERLKDFAAEFAAAQPDVMLTSGSPVLTAMLRESKTIPIVFVSIADPIAAGFVASMSRPGGNVTGFTNFEHSMAGKWLEILKEVAPKVTRALVIYNPRSVGSMQLAQAIEDTAPKLALSPTLLDGQTLKSIETAFDAFSREPGGGLAVQPDATIATHRDTIIELAARHRLPGVYPFRYYTSRGGLVSYGVDTPSQMSRAAEYVSRILRGEKPNDLPIQAPNKFELVVNLKTAKALGLTIPESFLLRADEVIE